MIRHIAAAALALAWFVTPPSAHAGEYFASVVRVIDGDTIVVDMDTGRTGVRVRLIGVDCPESRDNRKLRKDAGQDARHTQSELIEHGRAARAVTESLLPAGARVRLVTDKRPSDRYGRRLAYVYNGPKMINALLVEYGQARVMTVPPNDEHEEMFNASMSRAKSARLGIWE